jgi:hypothetical protein
MQLHSANDQLTARVNMAFSRPQNYDSLQWAHHDTHNPEDSDSTNPFVSNHPDSDLSHVEVPESCCPFADAQLRSFLSDVQPLLDSSLHIDMHSRRLLWIQALALASFTSRTEPSDT